MLNKSIVRNARSASFHLGPFWVSLTLWNDSDENPPLVKIEVENVILISLGCFYIGRI